MSAEGRERKYRDALQLAESLPLRKPEGGFWWLENEACDVFLPIIGPTAFAIWATLARKSYASTRIDYRLASLARDTGLHRTTVWRELRLLESLGIVRLAQGGGNSGSTCELIDTRKLCRDMGAIQGRHSSLVLPVDVRERLEQRVAAERSRLQGKRQSAGGNFSLESLQRDASVSPERPHRFTGETQTGFHQLRKNEKEKNSPSPTPSRSGEPAQQQNPSTNDRSSDDPLREGRDCFTGVMGGMRNHLLNPARPPAQHLTDGLDDWRRFGFDSYRVEAVIKLAKDLELTISADGTEAATAGFEKYRKTWEAQLRKWFLCDVRVSFIPKAAIET